MTPTAFLSWLDRFLDEKKVPHKAWTIEHDGNTHFIDSEVVVEAIRNAPLHEQRKIKDTLVRIDFANGCVNDYFAHLAKAIVERSSNV